MVSKGWSGSSLDEGMMLASATSQAFATAPLDERAMLEELAVPCLCLVDVSNQ